MPGIRIYPFKEIESGTVVDRNVIWESRAASALGGMAAMSGLVNVDLTPGGAPARHGARNCAQAGIRVVASRSQQPACRLVKRALIAGISSAGVHVEDLRVMPAAVNRHLLKSIGVDAGIHVRPSESDPETFRSRSSSRRASRRHLPSRRRSRSTSRARSSGVPHTRTSATSRSLPRGRDLRRRSPRRHDVGVVQERGSDSSSTTPTRRPRSSCRSCSVRSGSRRSRPRPTSQGIRCLRDDARRVTRRRQAARNGRQGRPGCHRPRGRACPPGRRDRDGRSARAGAAAGRLAREPERRRGLAGPFR